MYSFWTAKRWDNFLIIQWEISEQWALSNELWAVSYELWVFEDEACSPRFPDAIDLFCQKTRKEDFEVR